MEIKSFLIEVNDMDLAMDFYINKLNLGIKSQQGYPNLVVLKILPISLVNVEDNQIAKVSLEFRVEKLNDLIVEMKKKNVVFQYDSPKPLDPGTTVSLVDPFGNVIYLYEYQKITSKITSK